MSQQISFYMTLVDLRTAMKRIAECGDFVILHSRSLQPKPRIITTIEFEEDGKPWLYYYLTLPEYLQSIKMHEVPRQGYWSVDCLRSPVVELNRGLFDSRKIGEGRIYFETNYYDETGQKVTKPELFLKWAKCARAAIKKTLQRDVQRDAYVGPDALSETKDKKRVLVTSTEPQSKPPI